MASTATFVNPDQYQLTVTSPMKRHQHNDLAYYTFPALDAFRELVHGVTTRHGGVSTGQYASLNLTKASGMILRPWTKT